jgi:hypothetical protein
MAEYKAVRQGETAKLKSVSYRLMPCTYSNSAPNHVEAVTSSAPMLPAIRLDEKIES